MSCGFCFFVLFFVNIFFVQNKKKKEKEKKKKCNRNN